MESDESLLKKKDVSKVNKGITTYIAYRYATPLAKPH